MMIQAIFYSEFDNIAGPQIVYQAPPNALSNEVFDSVSGYIIIDKALCGKIITVCPQGIKIVGYPVCIEDDKYHRNALLFNIGFVFDKDADAAPYKPILRKLGALMESMEKEMGFLSKEASKATLSTILPSILHDLTMYGESTTTIDTANIINLKVFQKLPPPPNVLDHQVPVAIRDLHDLLKHSVEWDLALQKIVPHIDGVNYVKRIAIAAEVDIAIVKSCLRQLLYYRCITMIDIFMHSNNYATTPKLHSFFNDPLLQVRVLLTRGVYHACSCSKSASSTLAMPTARRRRRLLQCSRSTARCSPTHPWHMCGRRIKSCSCTSTCVG
ncbi:hypothetical protein, variant 2 [Aphanomyces astaci]|uniref:Nitrogen permease regulator 2 n=1 Tax=Aphanomyces astaci TaxID=112090 RepID=W4G7E4_APHAT|nr:hypothetical protein, variant 2 [Aphanomyces astaci]ETV75617.1 hypothetical protein, variant 2 [Aphanomyces astaci]|eukprot:XP_009834747.1 hypothetical protein, variant 2 [Aphanomyces astaci]